jgi:hypothetical protein
MPLLDVFWAMLIFFLWIVWFWLLITVFADIFRSHDLSGWGKAGWTIFVVALPYLGVLVYLIARGRSMQERQRRSAYEMIVLAFANGDRRALKDLLSSEVYESFEAVIKDREKHEQKTETRFVSIDKAELVSAEARDRAAQLTVRFVSQMISVTRDKTGGIVDGNPDKVADITDVWTFARDTSSRDPNWKLVGTGSAG